MSLFTTTTNIITVAGLHHLDTTLTSSPIITSPTITLIEERPNSSKRVLEQEHDEVDNEQSYKKRRITQSKDYKHIGLGRPSSRPPHITRKPGATQVAHETQTPSRISSSPTIIPPKRLHPVWKNSPRESTRRRHPVWKHSPGAKQSRPRHPVWKYTPGQRRHPVWKYSPHIPVWERDYSPYYSKPGTSVTSSFVPEHMAYRISSPNLSKAEDAEQTILPSFRSLFGGGFVFYPMASSEGVGLGLTY